MKYSNIQASEGFDYKIVAEFLKEMEALGYTFDYYLDAEPYNLRKMEVEEGVGRNIGSTLGSFVGAQTGVGATTGSALGGEAGDYIEHKFRNINTKSKSGDNNK